MRRKNTKGASKSTPEKNEARKSSRISRHRRSPSKSQDSEDENTNISSSSRNENTRGSVDDKMGDSSSKSKELIHKKNISEELENENVFDTHNDTSSVTEGGHTPPHPGPTGNEVPESDEGDAKKGKSKGIHNSQVVENSEIKMNSVTCGSAEEASTYNDVSLNESSNDNLVIQEQQNTGEFSNAESPNDQTEKVECNQEENTGSLENVKESKVKTDVKTIECSSANKIVESEKLDYSNVKVDSGDMNSKNGIDTENMNDEEADDDQAEEGEIRESKSDEENDNYGRDGVYLGDKVKKPSVKIKLRRDSFFEALEQLREANDPPQVKKMKWNPDEHRCLKLTYSDLYKLHINDFRALSSDLKLADEKDIKLEDTYKPKVGDLKAMKERKSSMDVSGDETERPEYFKQSSNVSSDDQGTNIIALNRKISIVDDAASKLRPPPSPAKQPLSPVLYISNLVRPFTIKQLRELLERTGTIEEDGFWTDRIKSKCYVHYNSAEEAEATRNALHGVNWPVGNGKKLIIEYSTEEEMEKARNPPTQPPAPPPQVTPPRAKTPPKKENLEPVREPRNGDRREERKRKDSDRIRERGRTASIREWDVGKESHRERSRSRSRERRRKHSGRRSITPLEDFIARKQRKLEESVPQKLMDDLFQRTKTMPCIYWQPLSPEEISIKQQQRLSRMEEHKRRLEENSRNRGAREPGRGAYRRRFD